MIYDNIFLICCQYFAELLNGTGTGLIYLQAGVVFTVFFRLRNLS